MICADLADIATFATGSIGGVHRGLRRNSFDVSADLQELAHAGDGGRSRRQAILDLRNAGGAETLGVPVIAFGRDQLPAASGRARSGLAAPAGRPAEIAASAASATCSSLASGSN